jgi:hypothetical protein
LTVNNSRERAHIFSVRADSDLTATWESEMAKAAAKKAPAKKTAEKKAPAKKAAKKKG